jgi:hypothetical protein
MCTGLGTQASTYLAHGPVCLQEVWLEEDVKQVACDAFNGVINGQHVDTLAILDVSALQDRAERDRGWGQV